MIPKLTIDEAWKYCLEMWKWISENANSESYVGVLKVEWLEEHAPQFENMYCNCFFCEYNDQTCSDLSCANCPGRVYGSDTVLWCARNDIHYKHKPKEFYAELLRRYEVYQNSRGDIKKDGE